MMNSEWKKVKLGEVLTRSSETLEPISTQEYNEITVRLWGNGVVLRGRILGASVNGRRFVARQGQFIASRIDARNGAMGLVPALLDGALVTNDFPLFDVNKQRMLPEFLAWLCRTRYFVDLCVRASEGTTNRVRLKGRSFLELEISLPPLAEQQRIVARIKELESQIEEARTLRRQTMEEVSAMLHSSRRTMLTGCTSKSVRLEAVCDAIIDNLHSNPCLVESGVPCIRSPDVGYGVLNLDSAQRTDEEEYLRRTIRGIPRENDIVLVREGGGVGKCALVLPNQKFSLGQRVMMLRPTQSLINPKFMLHQLLSPLVQDDQIRPRCKGSASPHLNISILKKFALVLPPMAEQISIVNELDALQEQIKALKQLHVETADALDALLPALLDRAYKGEL